MTELSSLNAIVAFLAAHMQILMLLASELAAPRQPTFPFQLAVMYRLAFQYQGRQLST